MNKIKQLRKEKKLTQEELAEKIGISKRTLAYWEKGVSSIKENKLKILCEIFGVDMPYLLGYTNVKTEADIKVSVLDETLKKLHIIKDNMILRESDEGPNLLELGLGTAIVAIESFKREIENGGEQ